MYEICDYCKEQGGDIVECFLQHSTKKDREKLLKYAIELEHALTKPL
jgi:hypothetical protein